MRAVVVEELAPEYRGVVLKEIPTPDPGPGEVLVEVRAAAVNFPDLLMTRGEYQHKPPLPFTPGMEVAGLVAAVALAGCGSSTPTATAPAATSRRSRSPDAASNSRQ